MGRRNLAYLDRHREGTSRTGRLGLLLVLVVVGGCADRSAGSVMPTNTASAPVSSAPRPEQSHPAASTPPASAEASACPNPNGGDCLGTLAGGTYRTTVFELPVTYTVPAGWQNLEDLPGNFLLLPPGESAAGVEAGTANYIGVGLNVALSRADCESGPDPDVGRLPGAIAPALDERPGLDVTAPESAEVGGLSGAVIDVKLDPTWSSTCPWSGGKPVVQLLIGLPPSNFENSMGPGFESRIYLLRHVASTLSIEIELVDPGRREELTRVAEQLRFGE